MKKFVAFNLYAKNEQGGNQPTGADGEMREVYLAADVELLLAQIRNGCVDDGDEALAYFKLSPGEIRNLIDRNMHK
jgi:hypothetical protein